MHARRVDLGGFDSAECDERTARSWFAVLVAATEVFVCTRAGEGCTVHTQLVTVQVLTCMVHVAAMQVGRGNAV